MGRGDIGPNIQRVDLMRWPMVLLRDMLMMLMMMMIRGRNACYAKEMKGYIWRHLALVDTRFIKDNYSGHPKM